MTLGLGPSPWHKCLAGCYSLISMATLHLGLFCHRRMLRLPDSIPQTSCLASLGKLKSNLKKAQNPGLLAEIPNERTVEKTQALLCALPPPRFIFVCKAGPLTGDITGSWQEAMPLNCRARRVTGAGRNSAIREKFLTTFLPSVPRSPKTESEQGLNRLSQALRQASGTRRHRWGGGFKT